MKRQLLRLICVGLLQGVLLAACANNRQSEPGPEALLRVPRGTPVTIDGVMEPSEWTDADVVEFGIDDVVDVTVQLKHDGTSLLLAFVYDRTTGEGGCHPELYIDADNDKSSQWRTDDWWFHVSATDCDARGTYDPGSGACRLEQPDWEAVRNPPPPEFAPVDTVEVRIPFTKIGVSVGKRIGIAFNVHHHDGDDLREGFWPRLAVMAQPATWGSADIR
jgi:hypothetical protein